MSLCGLYFEKVNLGEFDELLPFGRHVRQRFKFRNLVERLPVGVGMRPEEIVVSDEHGYVRVCPTEGTIAVCYTVGVLESAVKALNDLLEPSVLC